MDNMWEIIVKELSYHGIKIVNDKICQYSDENRIRTISIEKCIAIFRGKMSVNIKEFMKLWKEVGNVLNSQDVQFYNEAIDYKSVNLFIESMKDLFKFGMFVSENYGCYYEAIVKTGVLNVIRNSIDKDYKQFSKEIILSIPDYKITLDWIYRRNSILTYLIKLLKFAKTGQKNVCKYVIKTARGVQGPWGNLDLPMLERKFPWDDIEEEIRGRDRDIKRQRRYRMGLENYNNDGRVGEGYYWREIRNEPFSWYNRADDSPYPQRDTLGNWG